jgi:hypothetical protein
MRLEIGRKIEKFVKSNVSRLLINNIVKNEALIL